MKDRILYIETSTSLTSVALSEEGRIVACRDTDVPRSQASLTSVFIDEMLRERGLRVRDCDAVCVSKGPGSYTGLRVGSSTAKGLCFGADLPLIAVGTLDTLVAQTIDGGLVPEGCRYIIPMIDARRMEVYTAVFAPDGRQLTQTAPVVVDAATFADRLAEGPVLFIGDGALKCQETIGKGVFVGCCPRADAMLRPAMEAFRARRFEDTAYFEPFYLKQFVATVSAKKLF